MHISAINSVSMKGTQDIKPQPQEKQQKFTDKFQTKLKNSADMSDCITVPRTIFKGYLGIMAGTSALTAGSFVKNPAMKKGLSLTGVALSMYGTWSFVRPYILKGSVPTVNLNNKK